ncbi:anti-sigma regulatory factor [Fulvitalea axinellae]|uniref:Anti-sigma regulatory factor n=1 Tax=Fulvitalea axinellae TaxID=1182444 RepID=A0AAU9D9N4_9BACT|nr:anti-sigma regulatory factor [Fulvitalea axinellae]
MDSINLEIPSLPDNVRIVESFIDNSKDKYHLNDDVYGNIMIAVTEAVNNAIQHGNNGDKDKLVKLTMSHSDEQIRFTIGDEGPGFDYDSLPDPTAPENLHKPCGRGIFLMKHLCDEVEFNNDGKEVVLAFYLN